MKLQKGDIVKSKINSDMFGVSAGDLFEIMNIKKYRFFTSSSKAVEEKAANCRFLLSPERAHIVFSLYDIELVQRT